MIFGNEDFALGNHLYFSPPVSSSGGIQYDVLIAEPAKEAPKYSSPAKMNVSTTDIEQKLQAAENRRASFTAERKHRVIQQMSRLSEVQEKRQEFNNNFKFKTRRSLECKMESNKENREAYLKSIQDKARDFLSKAEETKRNYESPEKYQVMMEEFNKKMETASKLREANIRTCKERLRLHVLHIANIRKQMDDALAYKKERLSRKLAVATEKRKQMIQEIRDKMKDHAQIGRQNRKDAKYLNSIEKSPIETLL